MILDVVVDAKGKVESTTIVRSVPGLDEAAIAAARQWEYAPTKVDGKPVRVRVTVPITFALALPRLERQDGVPELRQGVSPAWPAGASGGGLASAELTLEPDGRVGVVRILEGGAPWSDALLTALKTWRFAPPPEDEVLSFRVEAEFVSGGSDAQRKVNLQATGLRRSGLLDEPSPAQAPASALAASAPASSTPPAASAPPPTAPPAQATPEATPQAAPQATAQPPAPASPAPAPPAPAPPAPAPPAAAPPGPTPPSRTSPVQPDSRPTTPAGGELPQAGPAASAAAAPPPVEVITAAPPPTPPENGVSAIRDVTLEPGVPDLTRGRRPVAPPLARMSGSTGNVEVAFSVSAAGTTTVQAATGPDLLKPAAEQAVASWVFRRTRADRAYLVAVFAYAEDKSGAVVRPQTAPPPDAAAAPAASVPAAPPPDAKPTPPQP